MQQTDASRPLTLYPSAVGLLPVLRPFRPSYMGLFCIETWGRVPEFQRCSWYWAVKWVFYSTHMASDILGG
jgi:hypothetical protein